MAKPTHNRLRSSSKLIENSKRTESMNDEEKRRKIDEILAGQKYIDRLNTEHVGKKGLTGEDLLEHFKNIQLDGSNLIIQLFMENPIKSLTINDDNGEVISLSSGIQQIDKRKRNTDVATWGATPFPVIDKGVIMAISPQVKLWYYEQKEKLAKYDSVAAQEFIIPEVGDIVYTNHFMFKETRYYPNKQRKCEDFVKNVEEVRLENFDMLFKVTNYEIESIVKRDRAHLLQDNTQSLELRAFHVSLSEYEKEQEEANITPDSVPADKWIDKQ